MADIDRPAHPGSWEGQVAFSEAYGGFAYRPGEVIVAGDVGREALLRRDRSLLDRTARIGPDDAVPFWRAHGVDDALALVEDLRLEGYVAQPNHVFFAHSSASHGAGCCCRPHPAALQQALGASPVFASPVFASPVFASPVFASPVFASGIGGPAGDLRVSGPARLVAEYRATGVRRSSARPVGAPVPDWPSPSTSTSTATEASGDVTGVPEATPRVLVLDTGYPLGDLAPDKLEDRNVTGEDDDAPDEDGDGHLDPAAGHGTFIAGVVEQLTPGCAITVQRALSTFGEGREDAIADKLDAAIGRFDIVNLSFGGYALDQPHLMAAAIRRVQRAGAVVVASAGNDATCLPTYPAAFPGVISVGALGPTGPAPFTNYGPWLRACAPGVDLQSCFFKRFEGPGRPVLGGQDPDDFHGWALWSGTSFAAPVVVAAIAREMRIHGVDPDTAASRVLDPPGLLRIADLGTVVNIQ
jgi:hypothetical protein